jgi:GTPase SAR1 family protein
MLENELTGRVEQLFANALARTYQREALAEIHQALEEGWQRLKQPMRVAIVGQIKAGKSTMMNALLGETIVPTGRVEATFNVNCFKYAPDASLVVHFKDGRPPERKAPEELERLTRRADEHRDLLLSIKYIEVLHPNSLLQSFNLIDTPGLFSSHKDDSQNTLDFLQIHGQELSEVTQREASNADAILFLFDRSLAADGKKLVESFQGPQFGQATPINSLGVLTRVDLYWPRPLDIPAAGREIIDTLQNDHPQLRRMFYTILPVCGFLAWGAQTLTAEEFATLKQLQQQVPEEKMLRKYLRSNASFVSNHYADLPIPPIQREALVDRLDRYGIWRAYQLLSSIENCDQSTLCALLVQESGLSALKQLVLAHFGNRAYLIKLSGALQRIRLACFKLRQNPNISLADQEVMSQIEGRFGQLRDSENGFRELTVLRDYYQNKLILSEGEIQQLLHITGEYGQSLRQRLALPEPGPESPPRNWQEILEVATVCCNAWRRRVIDPGASPEMVRAAGILGDAYDLICYQAIQQLKQLT